MPKSKGSRRRGPKFVWARSPQDAARVLGGSAWGKKVVEQIQEEFKARAIADLERSHIQTKQLWRWAIEFAEFMQPEMIAQLEQLHHYTWKYAPYRRPRPSPNGGAQVFREVSVNSDPASWWYPPRMTTRTRRWKTKAGEKIKVTTAYRPPWDMKPGLLAGRPHRAIPIPLSPQHIALAYSHYGQAYFDKWGLSR